MDEEVRKGQPLNNREGPVNRKRTMEPSTEDFAVSDAKQPE